MTGSYTTPQILATSEDVYNKQWPLRPCLPLHSFKMFSCGIPGSVVGWKASSGFSSCSWKRSDAQMPSSRCCTAGTQLAHTYRSMGCEFIQIPYSPSLNLHPRILMQHAASVQVQSAKRRRRQLAIWVGTSVRAPDGISAAMFRAGAACSWD